jgi:hypothetical protein
MHNRDQLRALARMSLAIKDPRPRAKVQALALGFLCGEKPKTIRKSAPLRRKIARLLVGWGKNSSDFCQSPERRTPVRRCKTLRDFLGA